MTPADYSLRPFLSSDHDFYWDMRVESYREYVEHLWGWDEDWQRAGFAKSMKDTTLDRQIIEQDGQPIGLLELRHESDLVFLKNVQVRASSQGSGIGGRVVRDVLAQAQRAGKDVTLQVFHINPRAHALYERLGFKKTGQSETHVHMRWVCPDADA